MLIAGRGVQGGHKSTVQGLATIDWIGSVLLIASTTAILWAIAYGGATKPWSDGGVIAGLVTGHVGLIIFVIWQGMPQCKNPIAPLRLFANRTSAIGFFLAFCNCIVIYWPLFMLPLYFQSVRGVSAKQSGIQLLPFILFFPLGSMLGGGLMAKTSRYKPFHILGFGLCTLSFGLCSILDQRSHKALWVVFQIFGALGIGIPIASYEFASAAFSNQFTSTTKDQVFAVYTAGLQRTWQIAVVFAGVPLLLSLFEKEIPLRQELETDFGMEDKNKKEDDTNQAEKA
ncbi:hypothetical protein QQS21_001739 [Conoideocrella luteorostrata]|uniref:Uncharacterized protein n=1 Tax=Conoideocrella luteorostrata TaxID=1105319 RepID=A0AAJ0FY13_9HYPO|nr:hypothetical protein QQS21_001739 [Conoideocrella luteorostrata]